MHFKISIGLFSLHAMDVVDQLLEKFHEVQTPGMEVEITSE